MPAQGPPRGGGGRPVRPSRNEAVDTRALAAPLRWGRLLRVLGPYKLELEPGAGGWRRLRRERLGGRARA